ncbi:MAG: hypothetical protein IPJ41_15220, partial [Phycisphaerales bacterium]|nr:hypothetical protein [Phycisphaerales bacterium]
MVGWRRGIPRRQHRLGALPDGTLEERVYYCQNWRADVVALMTSDGHLINQVRYDPYGVPFGIAKTDLEADGDVDNNDYTQYSTYYSGSTMPFADWNWDGTKNTSDITAYLNDKNADSGLGRGVLAYMTWSHAGAANRKGYAGYEIDPVLTGSEGWESVYHVRNRVYLSQLGRWTRRDPLGYVDGMGVYAYVQGNGLVGVDPAGQRKEWNPPPGCAACLAAYHACQQAADWRLAQNALNCTGDLVECTALCIITCSLAGGATGNPVIGLWCYRACYLLACAQICILYGVRVCRYEADMHLLGEFGDVLSTDLGGAMRRQDTRNLRMGEHAARGKRWWTDAGRIGRGRLNLLAICVAVSVIGEGALTVMGVRPAGIW